MSITVAALAGKIAYLNQDITNIRWTLKELIGWMNSAGREVVILKPNSLTSTANADLVAGTKQTVPTGALELINVIRNMGADGATPGRTITGVSADVLNQMLPDWHTATADPSVKHFVYDPKQDQKTYYVYPPQPAATTQKIEVVISITPAEIAYVDESLASYAAVNALGEAGKLDDIYEGAMIDYCLYPAYAKDSEHTANAARSATHYQAFASALGVKLKNEFMMAPAMQFAPQAAAGGGQ